MDPELQEMIGTGRPSDEVAVLLRLTDGWVPEGARIVARFGAIATARLPRSAIPRIHDTGGVTSVKAPRLYGPDWIAAPEDVDITDVRPTDERRPPGIRQTGRGVVVALIDWGLDFAHPDFRNRDGGSRVLALWDQRVRADDRSNNRYGYGWVHDQATISAALRQRDPYAALAYHPADAGSGPTHGTHTAGIAVGNGQAGGPAGMAPESDIVFVHLATAKGERGDNLGDSVALLEAIDFIAHVAGPRRWVLSLSMGRHAGPHDGCTLTEQGIDAALSEAPGRACVQSTGNYYSRPIHTQGVLRPGEVRDIGFHTGEEDGFSHEIDIWYSGRDRIAFEVIAPSRKSAGRAETGGKSILVANGQSIGRLYNRRRDPNNHDNQAHVYLDASAPRGAWVLRLYGTDVVDGRYHCWVERDPRCSTCQPSFDPGDVVPFSTTGTICNGFLTIAVGAYDAHRPERPLAPFSSSGPTRDGRLKPDIVAPGVQVLSARSAPRLPTNDDRKLARMSGTSMAAPFVAGTVALMFEAAQRPLPVRQTRELLLKAANPLALESQSRWGSGYVDVTEAVAAADAVAEQAVQSQRPIATLGGTAGPTKNRSDQESKEDVDTAPALHGETQRESFSQCVCSTPPTAFVASEVKAAESDTTVAGAMRVDASDAVSGPLVFRIAEAITFDPDKSFVFPRFRSVVEAAFVASTERVNGAVRIRSDRAILVAGHSDPRELRTSNKSQSCCRALAVVAILTLDPEMWERIAAVESWWYGNTEIEVMSSTVCGGTTAIPNVQRYRRNTTMRRELIRRYLKSLRPAWLPPQGRPLCPRLLPVIGSPPGVVACGLRHAFGPSLATHGSGRAEIYFSPRSYPVLRDCSSYRSWQSLDRQPIEPKIEIRDEQDEPYTGTFELTLPTGEILREQTDASGQWRRPFLPSGRYTLTVSSHAVSLLGV